MRCTYENITKNDVSYLTKKGNFTLLFGRDEIFKVNVFPQYLKQGYVNDIVKYCDELRTLLHDFSDLFTEKDGEIKHLKAEFYLEKILHPYFGKLGLSLLQQSMEN